MSLFNSDAWRNDYVDDAGEAVPAAEYDFLVSYLDLQMQGALAGVGAGVISGGAVAAATGLYVAVGALQALVQTAQGIVYLASANVQIPVAANSTLYLFAFANLVSGGGTDDSRTTGLVVWQTEADGAARLGGILLARIVTGASSITSVTDLRAMVPAQQMASQAAAIAELEAALGAAYLSDTPPADVDSRLSTLEALGGGGGGAPVYADALPRSSSNAETVGQKFGALDGQIDALQSLGTPGGNVISVPAPLWDVDAINEAEMVLALTTPGNTAVAESQVNAITVVRGAYGDGTGATPQYIDTVNSTWT